MRKIRIMEHVSLDGVSQHDQHLPPRWIAVSDGAERQWEIGKP